MTTLSNFAFNTLLFIPSKVVVHKQFTDSEIDRITAYFDNMEKRNAGTFNNEDPYNTRIASTAFITSPDDNTSWIYDKYNQIVEYYNDTVFKFDITGFNYIQYAEYSPGGKHNFHMDIGLDTPRDIDYRINEHMRKLTIVTLLSSPGVDFTGGEFELNLSEERFPIATGLEKGSIVIFPSFILHRVAPVIHGLRKTLTTWVIGPKFK